MAQRNIPARRTKVDIEVQTDFNYQLIPFTGVKEQFFQFARESWMEPFSDYFLLSQLENVIRRLKLNATAMSEFKTQRIINELTNKIHGLLARQLLLTQGDGKSYYQILNERQQQLFKHQIKGGAYEKKLDAQTLKIQELEKQIQSLSQSLKIYQNAAEQNKLYESYFRELKELTVSSKRITDFDNLLNSKILPGMAALQVSLGQVGRGDQSSKQRGLISEYTRELSSLSKKTDLSWRDLSQVAGAFRVSVEHASNPNWLEERSYRVLDSYDQLKTKYSILLSVLGQDIRQLLRSKNTFSSEAELNAFLSPVVDEEGRKIEATIINGWVGLGVLHCHRHFSASSDEISRHKNIIMLFQSQLIKLIGRYPQLSGEIDKELKQFIDAQIGSQLALNYNQLRKLVVRETEVVHVNDTFNYYSKSDKQEIYYLRILARALLDELKRVGEDPNVKINLDQQILEILRKQSLNGIDMGLMLNLFKPAANTCEMQVLVENPVYHIISTKEQVPLMVQNVKVFSNTSHFAVNLHQGMAYQKQVPHAYQVETVKQIATRVDVPYAVPTRVTQDVIKYEERPTLVSHKVYQDRPVEIIREVIQMVPEQTILTQEVFREAPKPYEVQVVRVKEVEVEKEVPKNVYKQINKIFKVEQAVPKVYREPKFEIVERPVHHVVVQKEIQFVEIERPIIERYQVAKLTEVMVEKPIYITNHCDCQKPQPFEVIVEKEVVKSYPKEIIVEKCHFVKGDFQERIVQVPIQVQVPFYVQQVKQVPVIVEKPFIIKTIQEKLVIVQNQIPYIIDKIETVQLVKEKPVIVKQIIHVPVYIDKPVPIYIQRILPQVVKVREEVIVEKIVEVPRVEIVQKIVQKIVVVPRIVERLVPTIQVVEVPFYIQVPCPEIIYVQVSKPMPSDVIETVKEVHFTTQVLRIEQRIKEVPTFRVQEVQKIVQVEVQCETIEQKLVEVIKEVPQIIHVDRIVEKAVYAHEIVPVQQRVEIPIEVQVPVEILVQKPVFYQQPIVQVDVHRVEREKVVELMVETVQIKEVQTPYIQRQKQIVNLPGETIILKEPQLHIVEVQKSEFVAVTTEKQNPVDHYLDIHKSHVVEQPTWVIPEKQVHFLEKQSPISVERMVPYKHQEMVLVEKPETLAVRMREGVPQQVVNVVTQEIVVDSKKEYPQPVYVDRIKHEVLYFERQPKRCERQVLVTNEKVKIQQVKTKQILKQVVRQVVQLPAVKAYRDRIVEKIMLLPQIVEIEKKIYMIQEINGLIAKQVDLQTHYSDYKGHMLAIENAAVEIITLINQGKQGNAAEFRKRITLFLELLRDEARIPKIVERIKQVEVIKERDRPVLVPVYDSHREKVLQCIVADLIQGINRINKTEIERVFPERIRILLREDFEAILEGERGVNQPEGRIRESRWKSWLEDYDKNLDRTIPEQRLTAGEQMFLVGYPSDQMDFHTIKASLQRVSLVNKQRAEQIKTLRKDYISRIDGLNQNIVTLNQQVSFQRRYKEKYYNQLQRIKRLLELQKMDAIVREIHTFIQNESQIITIRRSVTSEQRQSIKQEQGALQYDGQQRIADLLNQIANTERESNKKNKTIQELQLENSRLRAQIDEIKLNIPAGSRQNADEGQTRYSQQWEERIRTLEEDHFRELNHLRQQFMSRLADGSSASSEMFNKNYEDLKSRYTQLTQSRMSADNEKRSLISSYEDRLKDVTKQLAASRREYEALVSKSDFERKKLIDQYERRMTSTSTQQERQLRKDLDQARKGIEAAQQKCKVQKKRIVDDYERRLSDSTRAQEQLQRQIEQLKRKIDAAEEKYKAEKKKIVEEYQKKLKQLSKSQDQLRSQLDQSRIKSGSGSATQDKELKKQLDNLRRRYQALEANSQNERRRLVQEYEFRLGSSGSSRERQLIRELEILQRDYENAQKKAESSRSAGKGSRYTPEQTQEITVIKQKIGKLQVELQAYRRQIEQYQKSRMSKTAYSSHVKQSGGQGSIIEPEFQSPDAGRYKSSGPKLQEKAIEGSAISKEQEAQSQDKGRISKSGVRAEKGRFEEREEVRSSSSRVSGSSETTKFKTSMTMKQFMEIKKAQDKDTLVTLVMIKVIERIQEEADKGIINSYSPSNIFLTNFNPSNLDALNVRFGAPITNRKSKTDGLYLAPEILRGEATTLKSVVFTLAVIWDELIHYESYYKTVADIQNLAYEYKVRDTTLNPILRNTLFEMMSKDPARRLELGEAKRRLSLQRYIVGQARRV